MKLILIRGLKNIRIEYIWIVEKYLDCKHID